MIKSKYRSVWIIIVKILFISISVMWIYKNVSHKGEIMSASDLTTIGLNSFYYIDYNMQVKLDSFKIICITSIVFMTYAITLFKIHNFYSGLNETIRIRSSNLIQYMKKTINFYFIYIFIDVAVSVITIYVTMIVMNVENIFCSQVICNLILMAMFYMIIPFLLIFIVEKFEYFIVGLLMLTVFAHYFIYKLSLVNVVIAYVIVFLITYGLILIRERNK